MMESNLEIYKTVWKSISEQREEKLMEYLDEHPDVKARILDWKVELTEDQA